MSFFWIPELMRFIRPQSSPAQEEATGCTSVVMATRVEIRVLLLAEVDARFLCHVLEGRVVVILGQLLEHLVHVTSCFTGGLKMLPADLFCKVLRVVEVDLAKAAVSLHQVVLGGAQIDLTVLLAVLQLLHPETSSLEAAAVRQVIADDGCSRSSVVDSAHSFVSLRPGRVPDSQRDDFVTHLDRLGHKRGADRVLVRSDQEAVVDVSLHQTGFTHALLSQHHYFGIHPHHGHWVCEQKPGQDHWFVVRLRIITLSIRSSPGESESAVVTRRSYRTCLEETTVGHKWLVISAQPR